LVQEEVFEMKASMVFLRSVLLAALLGSGGAWAQDAEPVQEEQDDVSKALDSTSIGRIKALFHETHVY